MQRVHTASGSVYDVDRREMRIRRVHGKRGPSDSRPQDGIWRRISGIEGPAVGEAMVIYWAKERSGTSTDYGFRTTPVVNVVDIGPVESGQGVRDVQDRTGPGERRAIGGG